MFRSSEVNGKDSPVFLIFKQRYFTATKQSHSIGCQLQLSMKPVETVDINVVHLKCEVFRVQDGQMDCIFQNRIRYKRHLRKNNPRCDRRGIIMIFSRGVERNLFKPLFRSPDTQFEVYVLQYSLLSHR